MDNWARFRVDISRLLAQGGIALLLLAAIRFLGGIFPLGLLLPGWYLGLARELITISPVVITGLIMHLIASHISFADNNIKTFNSIPWVGEQRRLLQALAILFALVIPLQIGAAFLFDLNVSNTERLQLQAVQRQLALVRKQPPAGNANPQQIMQLQAMEAGLKGQGRQTSRRRFAMVVESLKVCASAAVLVWILRQALLLSP